MKKEIWDNKNNLFSDSSLNSHPLCTYQLPVLTGKDCEADGTDIYVNSFQSLYNVVSDKCITGSLTERGTYNELGIYVGSLWNDDCSFPNEEIRGRLLQLSYDSSYMGYAKPTLVQSRDNRRVAQLPIFMYYNLSSSSYEQCLGAVVFMTVQETWRPYNASYTETRYYNKLVFITWKDDGGFYPSANCAVSSIHTDNINASNNASIGDRLLSVSCELRILYSWWVNSPSSDNIIFWCQSDAYVYCNNASVLMKNTEFTNYANNGGFYVLSDDHIVYEDYTLPWDHSSANLMLSVGIYFGNYNTDPDFIEQ